MTKSLSEKNLAQKQSDKFCLRLENLFINACSLILIIVINQNQKSDLDPEKGRGSRSHRLLATFCHTL